MAFYLVTATPREDRLAELRERLARNEFVALRPFGRALSSSDYCSPPLAEERAAVLDRYFEGLSTEEVVEGSGWALIGVLPALFSGLAD
jgi:hypothetical protein